MLKAGRVYDERYTTGIFAATIGNYLSNFWQLRSTFIVHLGGVSFWQSEDLEFPLTSTSEIYEHSLRLYRERSASG